MKSPLIIGADVQAIADESLAILKNKWLIAINQDTLGVQGTLRSAGNVDGTVYELHDRVRNELAPNPAASQPTGKGTRHTSVNTANTSVNENTNTAVKSDGAMLQSMAQCSFGPPAVQTQRWQISPVPAGIGIASASGTRCLTRTSAPSKTGGPTEVIVAECSMTNNAMQAWDAGRTQVSISQVKDPKDATSCLAFNGTGTALYHICIRVLVRVCVCM